MVFQWQILIYLDRRIKIHKYSIFPLGFLTSRAILYDSACVYTKLKKNDTVFLSSTILNHSQSALHVTDNSRMKDVLQLTTAIVMASSAKKKNKTPKFLKHSEGGLLVIISLLKLMTRPIAHYENTRSVANIFLLLFL